MSNFSTLLHGDLALALECLEREDCSHAELRAALCNTMRAVIALQQSAAKPRRSKSESKSAATWTAYARAYQDRYGVEPVRNAQANALLSRLIDRLGAEEAPAVAVHYVGHQGALYVFAKHPLRLLLRDAEGLRTEWATQRTVTDHEAREADRRAAQGNVWLKLIKKDK